ncbi:hypothetical protein [Sediminibacterium sp.]|uniref:hypothetical protein n=1 Tax=Sediminibacterium sp. TaxID=1917865 RepID=UPI0025D6B1A6|nr:hypothetical protein [Sediminibacterium sp.]
MTTTEIEQYFQFHNSNIKLIKIGFDHTYNQIKALYRKQNKAGDYIYGLSDIDPEKKSIRKTEKALSRILSGIQVSWAEESIKRLLYEKNLLIDSQRTYLITRTALVEKWYSSLKILFCIAYDLVPTNDPTCMTVNIESERHNLGDELVDQYLELKRLITDFLTPNFTIRNKVQHGEWEFAFKPKFSEEYSQNLTDTVNHENLVTTYSRFTLVNAFYQMLVDLGRFKSNSFALDSITTPFEYFYYRYMLKIKFEINKILNPQLDDFIEEIVKRNLRGHSYKQS